MEDQKIESVIQEIRDDLYGILCSDRNASHGDLKIAYRRMAQKYHPDRNKEVSAKRKMQHVNLAWGVLSDPIGRTKYDSYISDLEKNRRDAHRREQPESSDQATSNSRSNNSSANQSKKEKTEPEQAQKKRDVDELLRKAFNNTKELIEFSMVETSTQVKNTMFELLCGVLTAIFVTSLMAMLLRGCTGSF